MLKYKDSTGEKKFKNKPSAAELNAQGLRQQGACKFSEHGETIPSLLLTPSQTVLIAP
jgi:hypothetical protein